VSEEPKVVETDEPAVAVDPSVVPLDTPTQSTLPGEPPVATVVPPVAAPSPQLAYAAVPFGSPSDQRLLGPALWVAGAVLWAYSVLGELVVNLEFSEGLAIPALFGVLVWNWFRVTKPLLDEGRTTRAALVAALAVGLFVASLLLITMMFGSSQRSHFEAVTVLVCALGVVSYAVGRRKTTLPQRMRRAEGIARVAPWFTWIVVGLFTLVAVMSAMARA
jgi:hypothetical protein